jgi:hypothetical protein
LDHRLFRSGIVTAFSLWLPPLILTYIDHGRWDPEVMRWWLLCAPGFAPVVLPQMNDWLPTTLSDGVSWGTSMALSITVWLFLAIWGRKSIAFQILAATMGLGLGIFAAMFAYELARMP